MDRPTGSPASPDAVIFDLDGTLVDTVETRIRAWLQVFGEEAMPTTRADVAALIGSDGTFLAHTIAERAGRPIDARQAEAIDRRSGEIYARLNREPRPLPGARELLAMLEARGMPWAIATSSRREQVDHSVRALGLAHQPRVVDGSHVDRAKPAPDLLLLAARELGVAAERSWYVGDATWDIRAARAAMMTAVGITTGAADAAALRDAGADLVLPQLAGLIARLD